MPVNERSLKDLFHLIKQVLPEDQDPVCVDHETTVGEALQLMQERGFSQLPVLAGNDVLGVFSYRSFANGISRLPEKVKKNIKELMALQVVNLVEEVPFARINDELAEVFNVFDTRDAVLVGSEGRLLGIVTTIDALRYFYRVASPYVLLREIELAVRELIRDSVDSVELKKCADQSLKKHYQDLGEDIPSTVENMSLHDYVMLLRFQGTWNRFGEAFGKNQDLVWAKLEPLPQLRNDVFHFRRDLTIGEYQILREARDWLLKRIRTVDARRQGTKG